MFASGAPGMFCSLEPNVGYRLTVAHPGYETRNLHVKLRMDGKLDVSGAWAGPVGRSLIVPGWGQMQMGNKTRGIWAFGLGAGTGAYLLGSYVLYQDAKDTYESTVSLVEQATTQEQLTQLQEQATIDAMKANVNKARFEDVLILTGYVHLNNIAETYLLARPAKASVNGNTVDLQISRKTRTRATMRSIFFPGLGQKYMGSQFKGWFMQSLFLGTAIWAIEERADFASAENAYILDKRRLDNTTIITDIPAAQWYAQKSWDYMKKRERRRDWAYIAVGTAYVWNVLDAALMTEPETRGGKIGFETSFRASPEGTSVFGTTLTWRF